MAISEAFRGGWLNLKSTGGMSSQSSSFLLAHRILASSLAAMFFVFIAWAGLAHIEIVANAEGKLVPASFVRVAQPVEDGLIKRVLVKDGQQVKAGEPLVELDPLYAQEDAQSAFTQKDRLALQLSRIDAELTGRVFVPNVGPPELRSAALAEFNLRKQALMAALSEASASVTRAKSDLSTSLERLRQADQVLPLVARQSKQQKELQAQGFVSEAVALDKDKELVAARQDLAVQTSAVETAKAVLRQAEAGSTRIVSDYKKQLVEERAQVLSELSTMEADVAKRSHRLSQMVLKAPVSGTVNGLASLSAGQVVKAGQTLLSVVPRGERLRFEGWLRNEDAAYVGLGMPVRVKLAAYPFQKYGWIDGEVSWVGVDSETPEAMRNMQGEPLFYKVRIDLGQQELVRDEKRYPAKPGMQAVADVQLGSRTLFEYFTSPMRKVLMEAARER